MSAMDFDHENKLPRSCGSDDSACSESLTIDEILAGNALFFLLNLKPLYDYINGSTAPREVAECLKRINLAAASIQGALGNEGYARAKARDEKMNADLDAFLSHNVPVVAPPTHGASSRTQTARSYRA